MLRIIECTLLRRTVSTSSVGLLQMSVSKDLIRRTDVTLYNYFVPHHFTSDRSTIQRRVSLFIHAAVFLWRFQSSSVKSMVFRLPNLFNMSSFSEGDHSPGDHSVGFPIECCVSRLLIIRPSFYLCVCVEFFWNEYFSIRVIALNVPFRRFLFPRGMCLCVLGGAVTVRNEQHRRAHW